MDGASLSQYREKNPKCEPSDGQAIFHFCSLNSAWYYKANGIHLRRSHRNQRKVNYPPSDFRQSVALLANSPSQNNTQARY
jgi:hypothetical protein